MLRLESVTFENGSFRLHADFAIEQGRCVAIMGASGAGKSTLVNGIAGFHAACEGRVRWQDADITKLPPGKRPVAMLFQEANLFPHMTIRQNAGLGLRPDLRLTDADWRRVDQALDRVGLGELCTRKPAELSGGQQSRAALARVLLQGRPMLVLDEAFAALGPALRADMMKLVVEMAHEIDATVLMVTHDPNDAIRVADQIVVLADGVAHPPADAKETLAAPPEALKAYLGEG